ncbi:MAG: sporulation protein YabP [Clostridia bacterium]
MMVEDKKVTKSNAKTMSQSLIMENREKLSVSGVLDVENFDDQGIILNTELGVLIVRGDELHINKLDIGSGELIIEGEISSCTYTDQDHSKSKGFGFIGRMFR